MVCHPIYVLVVAERMQMFNVICLHTQSEVHTEEVSSLAEVCTIKE